MRVFLFWALAYCLFTFELNPIGEGVEYAIRND